jgi:hypothetical protein
MNFFQKWKGLKTYKRLLKENREILNREFNLRIDNIYRCYTVLNFPQEEQGIIQTYGLDYIDGEVRKYVNKVHDFFRELGLFEAVGLSEITQLDNFNVLIVIRYKYFDTKKLERIKYWTLGLGITILIALLFFLIF